MVSILWHGQDRHYQYTGHFLSSCQTLVGCGMVVENCCSSSWDQLNKSYFILRRVTDNQNCTRNCAKHFTCHTLFSPHDQALKMVSSSLFYTYRNGGSGYYLNFPVSKWHSLKLDTDRKSPEHTLSTTVIYFHVLIVFFFSYRQKLMSENQTWILSYIIISVCPNSQKLFPVVFFFLNARLFGLN